MPRILTQADIAGFRSRLCEVAAQLFAELGYEGFNMRELAKRLGVSAMTPYRYFKDKDAILSEVRAQAFAKFADRLEESLAGGGATLGSAYARFAIEQQTLYRLMFDLSQAMPGSAMQAVRIRTVITSCARTQIERGIIEGDAETLGAALWAAMHGVTALYLTGQLSSEEFHGALCETVRRFVGGAFAPLAASIFDLGSPAIAEPWLHTKATFEPAAIAGE